MKHRKINRSQNQAKKNLKKQIFLASEHQTTDLHSTAGKGWYQEWGKEARELNPGDVVYIEPAVKHWHGSTKDSWFSHIAVECPGVECSNEWCEPVSDEEYGKLK